MIPSCSWVIPGRKPGTSTRTSSGTLNASQVRTKRAAFSLAAISIVPARWRGWLATTPTACPSRRPKPQMMFGAYPDWISKNSPPSRIGPSTSCMSYGFLARLRYERVELGRCSLRVVVRGKPRGVLEVVGRQVREEVANLGIEVILVGRDEMGHAAALHVGGGAPELLVTDLFSGDSADDIRPGDEHLAE